MEIPLDIRPVTRYNGVRWVHEYQEACMDKVERFIKGELNRTPSIAIPPQTMHSNVRRPNMTSVNGVSSRWPTAAAAVTAGCHRTVSTRIARPVDNVSVDSSGKYLTLMFFVADINNDERH